MSNYPTAVDSAASLLTPVDATSQKTLGTTLTAICLDSDTTIQVADAVGPGFAANHGVLTIEDEIVIYTGRTGTTFTGCVRGAFGTQAIGHSSGTAVNAYMVAGFLTKIQEAVVAVQTAVGITGAYNFAATNHAHAGYAATDHGHTQLAAGLGVGIAGLPAWALTSAGSFYLRRLADSGGHAFEVDGNGTLTARYKNDVGGNVGSQWISVSYTGIVTFPQKRTQLGAHGGTYSAIPITDANLLLYRVDDNNWAGVGVDGAGNLWVRTGLYGTPDYRLMVGNSGNIYVHEKMVIGIVDDPAYPLDVNGIIRSRTGGFQFPDNSVQTTAFSGTMTNYYTKAEADGKFAIASLFYTKVEADARYAAIGHTHSGIYAAIDHNHDDRYAGVTHNHNMEYAAKTHYHDERYAALDHNHDGEYASYADYTSTVSSIEGRLGNVEYLVGNHSHSGTTDQQGDPLHSHNVTVN